MPKKTGGHRPIVNLKPLNKFIVYEHFKMENLETVRFLVRKGDWFVKLDLKDAYLTVPVHNSHQKYLRFQWEGRVFQFKCMAFGLAPAPRIFIERDTEPLKWQKISKFFHPLWRIRHLLYIENKTFEGSRRFLKKKRD